VYVFYGESFHTETAARQLIEQLVPPAERSWNLEVFDGRTVELRRVLDSLRTSGFGAGYKVVWLKETPLFLSGESRPQATAAMIAEWRANRQRPAAEKLLSLVALAGWTQEQFETADFDQLGAKSERALFGAELEEEDRRTVAAIAAAARELGLEVVPRHDQAETLVECVESSLAPRVVFLLTTSSADQRRRAWQRLLRIASTVEFVVERERDQSLSERSVADVASSVARSYGKVIDPRALRVLAERAGTDPQRLAGEVEKLCLWAGERNRITAEDVQAVANDLAETWVFDFTAAFAERELGRAVTLLRELLLQGEVPLRVLALLAREVRLLLLARETLDEERGGKGVPREFTAFQKQVLPALDPRTREAFGNLHPFVLFRCLRNAERWSAKELRAAYSALARLDMEMKSGRLDPAFLLERFVWNTLRDRGTQSPPQSRVTL
jgi:DNA polymerase-3 subunit delta